MKILNGRFFILVLITGLVIFGCDSQSNEEEIPPELIPSEAFTIHTDLFSPGAAKDAASKFNFASAAFRVWPVSLIVSANLIIPTAVTAAALQDTPELIDGAWEWSTTTDVEQSTVQFSLSGRPSGSIIDWSLRISGTDPAGGEAFDEFELLTAQSTVGEKTGSWQLYYRVNGVRTNVLNADYTVDSEEVKSISFSVPLTAAEAAGDSVTYESDGDGRRFLWQQIAGSLSHDIEWNDVTHEGSITATNYNAGVRGCWDTNLDDVDC